MKTSAKYLLSMIVFALAFSIMIFANIHGIGDVVEVKRLEPIEILKSNPAAKGVNAEKAEVKQIDKEPDESTVYIHDEADVEMLARLIWGEARGVASDTEKAAVVWCVLNRVDAERWPDTIAEVITQPYQFSGYSAKHPVTDEFKEIASDVLTRYRAEKDGGKDVGRVLPAEYCFFTGDGERNYFTIGWKDRKKWDWTLESPYAN